MPEPECDHRAHEGENRLHPCVATNVGVIAALEQLTLRHGCDALLNWLKPCQDTRMSLSGREALRDAAYFLTDEAWRAPTGPPMVAYPLDITR
jgi:hypothetical protein